MTSQSNAVDFAWTARISGISSDNIYRSRGGLQEYGTLLRMDMDFEINEQWGRRSLGFLAGGGWETIESDVSTTEDVYRYRLNAVLPWSSTGRIEGSAETSRETESPEPDDIDQGRLLTTRSEFGLSVGNRFARSSSYQAGIYQAKEEREDRDYNENSMILQWSDFLSPRRSINWLGRISSAEETILNTSWEEFYTIVTLSDQMRPIISMNYEIDFNEFSVDTTEGTKERSYRFGLQVRYEAEGISGWTYNSGMGIDHLVSSSGERSWEPRAEVSAQGPLSRTLEANGTISSFAELEDPLDFDTEWVRESRVEAGLDWNIYRTFLVTPFAAYLYQDFHNRDQLFSEDKTILYGVFTSWTPLSPWLLEFGGVVERRNSSDQLRDLEEKRLELRVATTYP